MPELPDVVLYIDALQRRIVGQRLERLSLSSPFVLRSVEPGIDSIVKETVTGIRRSGKRIVLQFDPDVFLAMHLMIAGRLRWREPGEKPRIAPRALLATFEMSNGTLLFTEAASHKRASIQLLRGETAFRALDRGGIEPLEATPEAFHEALTRENHTLKRALTDPRMFSGIGNAYSDEILHAARLSPLKQTRAVTEAERGRLYHATRDTLQRWIDRLRAELSGRFPEKVTAFHDQMAVHGRFRLPCPDCGTPVQRIVYASNECNYCARCQTGGRLLADRSLSRLLREDWPRSIDEL
ncbi:MAG TPA: DNA-formamidopyrimidine glycosylase family protein [Vicinamibacterales bacterium]|nr:DNA-formamidopyrimidine glycosylase family protein [Vicinamibacterales bacterium]